ncbi:MAG: carboxypeptidase regulatory-like domain-containing protein, partial [Candidatus Omnitrophica bacterium]|nr:carboxypeptidase regulatory-like domain-containing protein [Candidatus Omnitrophota bacterium]
TDPEGITLTKEIEFEETGEGFWQPSNATVHLDPNYIVEMEVDEFELNGSEPDLETDLDEGRNVIDYRESSEIPDVYMNGAIRKTYEEIISDPTLSISGIVKDKNGKLLSGVRVQGLSQKVEKNFNGRVVQAHQVGDYLDARVAWTDDQGRFALSFGEAGEYGLRFSAKNNSEKRIAYIETGTDDLNVEMSPLGQIKGQVVRVSDGRKVPVPNATVEIERLDHDLFSSLPYRRTRTATTNSNGEFEIDNVRTYEVGGDEVDQQPVQRKVSCQGATEYLVFRSGEFLKEVELVLPEPDASDKTTKGPRLQVRYVASQEKMDSAELMPLKNPSVQDGYALPVESDTLLSEEDFELAGMEPHGNPGDYMVVLKVKPESQERLTRILDDSDRSWIAIAFDGQILARGPKTDFLQRLPQGNILPLSGLKEGEGKAIEAAVASSQQRAIQATGESEAAGADDPEMMVNAKSEASIAIVGETAIALHGFVTLDGSAWTPRGEALDFASLGATSENALGQVVQRLRRKTRMERVTHPGAVFGLLFSADHSDDAIDSHLNLQHSWKNDWDTGEMLGFGTDDPNRQLLALFYDAQREEEIPPVWDSLTDVYWGWRPGTIEIDPAEEESEYPFLDGRVHVNIVDRDDSPTPAINSKEVTVRMVGQTFPQGFRVEGLLPNGETLISSMSGDQQERTYSFAIDAFEPEGSKIVLGVQQRQSIQWRNIDLQPLLDFVGDEQNVQASLVNSEPTPIPDTPEQHIRTPRNSILDFSTDDKGRTLQVYQRPEGATEPIGVWIDKEKMSDPDSPPDIQVWADKIVWDPNKQVAEAEGHVKVHWPEKILLESERMSYDHGRRTLSASTQVKATHRWDRPDQINFIEAASATIEFSSAGLKSSKFHKPVETTRDTSYGDQTLEYVEPGRVEGQVWIGDRPASNAQVIYDRYAPEHGPSWEKPIQANSEGRFVVDYLPPGKYRFSRLVSWTQKLDGTTGGIATGSHGTRVEVKSGETATVRIGGYGRPITGRFVLEENAEGETVSLAATELRYLTLKEKREKGYGGTILVINIEEDNTFTVPDVTPGTYEFAISVRESIDNPIDRIVFAEPSVVEIPEIPQRDEDEPYDLGEIRLSLNEDFSMETPERGVLSGHILNASTGAPIADAFVAIDHSGDSGGANLERFKEEGIYATTRTGSDGAFVLDGLAYDPAHPLDVTHPGFIRDSSVIAITRVDPSREVDISLRPGGVIQGRVVNEAGDSLSLPLSLQLNSEDGRPFYPHDADWPASPNLSGQSDYDGHFSFDGLDSGLFSVNAWIPLNQSEVHYYGGVSGIKVQTGATAEVELPPFEDGGDLLVTLTGTTNPPKFQPIVIVSPDLHLLDLLGGPFHPEDERIGDVLAGSMRWLRIPDEEARFENLPEGEYAVLAFANIPAGSGTAQGAVHVLGERVEVKSGEREEVALKKPE